LGQFQLVHNETNELVTNCDQFESFKHSSSLPFVFLEKGVAILSTVLQSKPVVQVSIQGRGNGYQKRKIKPKNPMGFLKN